MQWSFFLPFVFFLCCMILSYSCCRLITIISNTSLFSRKDFSKSAYFVLFQWHLSFFCLVNTFGGNELRSPVIFGKLVLDQRCRIFSALFNFITWYIVNSYLSFLIMITKSHLSKAKNTLLSSKATIRISPNDDTSLFQEAPDSLACIY